MCESFPDGSDEVYILRNLASILLFVYGTRREEARRAHDLFNQGRWEDLWKLALKAGERAKARAAKNPRQSKANSEPQKDKYAQKCARAGNLSKAAKSCNRSLSPLSLLTPSTSYASSVASSTPRMNWNTTRNSGPHLNRRLIFGKVKRAEIS